MSLSSDDESIGEEFPILDHSNINNLSKPLFVDTTASMSERREIYIRNEEELQEDYISSENNSFDQINITILPKGKNEVN